jgi:hypothetical protein
MISRAVGIVVRYRVSEGLRVVVAPDGVTCLIGNEPWCVQIQSARRAVAVDVGTFSRRDRRLRASDEGNSPCELNFLPRGVFSGAQGRERKRRTSRLAASRIFPLLPSLYRSLPHLPWQSPSVAAKVRRIVRSAAFRNLPPLSAAFHHFPRRVEGG